MTDKDVLERISKGDEKALDYLYKKYYKMMTNMVIKNSGTENEAKDIFQDALIVFWEKVTSNNLILTSKISTFLYSICQNLWRKELDRKNRFSDETKDEAVYIENEKYERIRIVNECINLLSPDCRDILNYFYFDNLPMTEIAKLMGLANPDAAKTKKYKCKRKLDSLIKKKYSESDFLE